MGSPVKDVKYQHIADGYSEIVARGRGWLRSRNPITGRQRLSVQDGNRGWHRGEGPYTEADEIDTDWMVSGGTWDYEMTQADYQVYMDEAGNYQYVDYETGEYVTLNVTFFGWTNDQGGSQQIPFQQVDANIIGDILEWYELFGAGTSVQVQTQTARLAKFVLIANLNNLPAPTIGGTNIKLTFSYQMIRSSDLDVYIDGAKWNNNSTVTTVNHVEFREKFSGKSVWWFCTPVAWDADGNQVSGSQTLKKAGANLFVDGHIPYAWMQSATYPITIDPTIDPQVAAGADDAEENPTGTVSINNGQPRLQSGTTPYTASRFTVTGPANGDTINSSYISLYNSNGSRRTMTIYTDFVDADDPSQVSAGSGTYAISNLTLTGNAVSTSKTGTASTYNATEDLATPLQAVIDRGGWASGNHVNCVCDDNGGDYQYYSYDGSTSNCPVLHIDYTAAGGEEAVSLLMMLGVGD